jgi:membrane-associated phospholipid phosphatase
MTGAVVKGGFSIYCRHLGFFVLLSVAQLLRKPLQSPRALAARRLSRHWIYLVTGGGVAIIALMFVVDVSVIGLMPTRGTPELWLARILTDLAKFEYVLFLLGMMLLAIAFLAPVLKGLRRAAIAGLGLRVQFLLLAVVVPNLFGEMIKGAVGRGRPFVGGAANAFNYSPMTWTEQFASFPSGHAITAVALAFAVSAVWPRMRFIMVAYALLIAATRVLLLAHHPSDVLAGALIGLLGAMFVRQWFAARRLGFAIHEDGSVCPLPAASVCSKT